MSFKQSNLKTQILLVVVSLFLFIIKIFAWYITSSVAILTDAMESTVNVLAGFIGLYSLYISSKPRDVEHPYGHGKVEFITSAFEGILISIAGLLIIYKATINLFSPQDIQKLDLGFVLILFSGIVNYFIGRYCVAKGKKGNSPVLISSGKHLISDTYSTLGLLLGLILMMISNLKWIDSIVAIIFAFVIIYTGYKIIKQSISGMMDETDMQIIEEVKNVLNQHRAENSIWIDVHNMRIINYSGFYHIDCHLTLPYYFNVKQGHDEMEKMVFLLNKHFNNQVEFFIHIDPCQDFQCAICLYQNCDKRKNPFTKQIIWTKENVLNNTKHKI
jgi:cation diffusion facilitator family transporter